MVARGAPEQHFKDVLESTIAIAFMGTPHVGSAKAEWAAPLTRLCNVLRKTNSEITQVLKPGSEMLANLQEEFHGMLRDRSKNHQKTMELFCFYEEVDVVGVGAVGREIAIGPSSIMTDQVYPDCTEAFGNTHRVSEPEHTCQPHADDEVQWCQRCGLCQYQ